MPIGSAGGLVIRTDKTHNEDGVAVVSKALVELCRGCTRYDQSLQ